MEQCFDRAQHRWNNRAIVLPLVATASIAFLFSLAGRMLAETFLPARVPLLGEFVGLSPTENAGVAFGITFSPLLQIVLISSALLLVAILAWQSRKNRIQALGFGLILGGALANIVDRFDDGFVTDFFQVGSWPTFNVADSCITIGVGVLLLCYTRLPPHGHPLPH